MNKSTYSMWSLFRSCRRAFFWRYVKSIIRKYEDDAPLRFGTLIHSCLEKWHTGAPIEAIEEYINEQLVNHHLDEKRHAEWHMAIAMMRGYSRRYSNDTMDPIEIEGVFTLPLINPATGKPSKSFSLDGKFDGLVREDGLNWLLEHKTASYIGGDYISKLLLDFQSMLYIDAIERTRGIKIAGCIYNVLLKVKLQQREGETDEQFAVRYAELCAKNKSGTSNAKKYEPESDENFQKRLAVKYDDRWSFMRQRLYFSRDQFEDLRSELWELSQQALDCRRRKVYYKNTANCFQYRRPCPYWRLCTSNNSSIVLESEYTAKTAHSELEVTPQDVDEVEEV